MIDILIILFDILEYKTRSHVFLLKIVRRPVAAGIYSLLPLGKRVTAIFHQFSVSKIYCIEIFSCSPKISHPFPIRINWNP